MQIFLSVLLAVLIVGLNAALVRKAKLLMDPAVVFSLFFSAQMLLALLLLQADIGGEYDGFFWLTAGIAAFALGAALMRRYAGQRATDDPVRRPAADYSALIDARPARLVFAALIVLAFTQPLSLIYRMGYRFTDLFSLRVIVEINTTAAYDRYVAHDVAGSAVMQAFLVLVYVLPLIGGFNLIYARRKLTRALCVLTVTPSLLVLLTQNTKAAFIGSVLLFLCSLTVAKIHRSGAFFRFRTRCLLILLPVAAVFLLLNYITFFLRQGGLSWSLFEAVNNKALNYLLGQIPAFNHWFSRNLTLGTHTFGMETFYSVSDALDLLKREPGIYTEKLVTAHLNTNVYTAFRPLIEDFSAVGALAALFATGCASGYCFERLRAGRSGALGLAFLTALYFYIVYAFITSPWAYASYTAAMVLYFFYLALLRRCAATRGGRSSST